MGVDRYEAVKMTDHVNSCFPARFLGKFERVLRLGRGISEDGP